MAAIPGTVGLTGIIAPKDELDTYAVFEDIWGKGGYRVVDDNTARDAIPDLRRKLGMLTYNTAEQKFYQLKTGITNSDWEEVVFDTAKTTSVSVIAGEPIGVYRVVHISESDGKAYLVDKDTQSTLGKTMGINTAVANTNENINIIIDGEVTNGLWSFTYGDVFVGDDGVLTQPKPASGVVVKFGIALSATTILIDYSIDEGDELDGGSW